MARNTVRASFRMLGTSVVLPIALAVLLSCIGARSVSAQNGKTILLNMIGTYRGLTSYQGRVNASLRQVLINGKTATDDGYTATIVYQKPNKLKLDFTMPQGGRTIYCDGKTLAYFQNRTQTYSTTPVDVADLRQLCAVLSKLQIVALYDTLYFLAGNNLPNNIVDITRKPDDMRDGRPVYVVSAHEKTPSGVYTLTWMVDKQTNMLARLQGRTSNAPKTLKIIQKDKVVQRPVRVDRVSTQNIVERMPNSNINPDVFVFHPPATARSTPFGVDLQKPFRGPASIPTRKAK
jgi:outer membrane lipoprotein-sorting protein